MSAGSYWTSAKEQHGGCERSLLSPLQVAFVSADDRSPDARNDARSHLVGYWVLADNRGQTRYLRTYTLGVDLLRGLVERRLRGRRKGSLASVEVYS